MKDLNKSLALLNEFFEETPKNEICRIMAEVDAMFTSDISFEDYYSLMCSAYDFGSEDQITEAIPLQAAVYEYFSVNDTEPCTVGGHAVPVKLKDDVSYTENYDYNLAA